MKKEIHALLDRADKISNGLAKADLTREAVRLADVAQEFDLQFLTRLRHVTATSFSGLAAEAILAYTWLLNHREAFGDREDHDFLWAYKWILDSAIEVPDFSREQVEYFIADARKRYEAYLGPSTRVIDSYEASYRSQCGDLAGARQLLEGFERAPRGELSNCLACEESGHAYDWFVAGDVSRAVEIHDAFVKARRSCSEEPMRAYCRASLFYAVAGRWEEAEAMCKAGVAKISRAHYLTVHCLLFCIACKLLAGREAEALALFDRALADDMETIEKIDSFRFSLISHRLMERLMEQGRKTVRLMSVDRLPMANKEGEVPLPELSAWLLEEAAAIGRQFDKRNGADYFAQRIEARWPFVLGAPD